MASFWFSKPMWRAVLFTMLLRLFSDVIGNYVWGEVWSHAKSMDGTDAIQDLDDSEWFSFTREDIRTGFQHALLLPLCYQWQVWLEKAFPSRPWSNTQFKDKPMSNVDERFEEEIMQRLISEGKVQRASLRWANVFIKVVLDFVCGSIIFGTLWVPVVQVTSLKFDSTAWTLYNFVNSIISEALSRVFSISIIASFFTFCLVPVEHRLPVLEGIQLIYSAFWGSVFRILIPHVANSDAWKQGVAAGREQALLLEQAKTANLTLEQNSTATLVSSIA